MSSPAVSVTLYLEVLSSWCHWAEPAWDELKARFSGRVAFDWRIAAMPSDAYPTSREACDRYYRRSGTVVGSPVMLHSGWLDSVLVHGADAPGLVAQAARSLGFRDDRVRRGLAEAAVLRGEPLGEPECAIAVAVALGVDESALRAVLAGPGPAREIAESSARFAAYGVDQRPTFVVESAIGDRAILSGTWRAAPVAAAIDAQLADASAYAAYHAHHGRP